MVQADVQLAAPYSFEPPAFAAHLDADAHRRHVQPGASVKGLFFQALLAELGDDARGARRYAGFRDYPMVEYMDLLLEVARAKYEGCSIREALRRLGQTAFPTFAESMIGRVIVGIQGADLDAVFSRAPRAYHVCVRPAVVTARRVAEGHWRMGFERLSNFLDSYQVGVVEGAILYHQRTPSVQIHLTSIDAGIMDIRWT